MAHSVFGYVEKWRNDLTHTHRIKTGEAELVGVFGRWPSRENHISSESQPAQTKR